MKARVNVYRNLHKQLFSVRLKGKVIDHQEALILHNCKFISKQAGREKVRREKKKNVHAWISAERYEVIECKIDVKALVEIYYCPYSVDVFCLRSEFKNDGVVIGVDEADKVLCINNKIYFLCSE
jgi:peroxiredoxin family protein